MTIDNKPGEAQPLSPTETLAAARINRGIEAAQAGNRLIDHQTARLIAACVHRGLGGELAQFADTGKLIHPHAARLELFHSLADQPGFTVWRSALKEFINEDARNQTGRTAVRTKVQRPVNEPAKSSAQLPTTGLPEANSDGPERLSCDARALLVYVAVHADDAVSRSGLAMALQAHACRHYVHRVAHRRLEAVFADTPDSGQDGLHRLLAHLAVCHNRTVIVHRLDRLPAASAAHLTALDALLKPISGEHPPRQQARFFKDMAGLAARPHMTKTRAHKHKSKKGGR